MFWESSVLDIQDMISAEEKRLIEKMKQDVIISFAGADAIATRVAYFFSDEKKRRESDIVMPWDRFPSLFEDKQEEIEEKKRQTETERYKANLKAYAERWNRRHEHGTERDL